MKKGVLAVSVLACALVIALAGCSSGTSSSAASSSSTASSSATASSASAASSEASASSGADSSSAVGLPDPWHEVSSARDAAAGAGINGFSIPEGEKISLGTIVPEVYRYMENIAEADVPIAAVEITIRKGIPLEGMDDISGDYNTYDNTWTQTIGDREVTCSGNREGEATKTVWTEGDYSFCILARGLGGDTDYGLKADDLDILVSGIM